jgi:hypothetical protein
VKVDRRFPVQVVGVLAGASVIVAFPLVRYGSMEVLLAAAAGAVLSAVNVLLGYLAIEYSFEKSYTTFLKAVLGGMGARMVLILAALLVLIKVVGLHTVALTVSLLSFYLVFLILELLFIQRKVAVKNQR